MSRRAYIMGAAALGLVASHAFVAWHFHGRGYDKRDSEYAEARRQTEGDLLTAAQEVNRRALQFQEMNAARSFRVMEVEDAARKDVDVCRVPSADSLRRLEWRWGTAERP
ncbi:MAG: hypothetical protein JXQ79_10215 [Rhodobacteraceae bacterium]|nr:hypothetical protein [Paracoccaceae bacterium]